MQGADGAGGGDVEDAAGFVAFAFGIQRAQIIVGGRAFVVLVSARLDRGDDQMFVAVAIDERFPQQQVIVATAR